MTEKNRTAQLILQSVYCALALVGMVGSIGFYDMKFTPDFYIYFTNLSNYLGAFFMLVELVQTARRSGDGYVSVAPRLKFVSMLGLLLTCLVFSFLLARDPARDPAFNYKVECILCHLVLPVLFAADWLLFYERGKARVSWPFLSALFPTVYLLYVFIHAACWHFDSSVMNYAGADPVVYPYFFLDPERVGLSGAALWILALLAAFIALGFLLFAIDRLLLRLQKKRAKERP